MRKTIAGLSVLLLLLPSASALGTYSVSSAVAYLSAHKSSPWTVMGLVAAGSDPGSLDFLKSVSATSAIQYEAPILAITADGHDPRTFGTSDLVAQLISYHSSGQLGESTTLNDDIFGLLALVSAGMSPADPVVIDSKNFLLTNQNSDGGWGFTTTGTSDTNSTASAILALLAAGIPSSDSHITEAENYLHTAQNDDGGFPYDPQSSYGTASDSSSTAWVIWAMNALAIADASWSKPGGTPRQFLASTQTEAGYFEYQSGSGEDSFSPITTSYAVIALNGKSLPLKILPAQQEQFDFRIEGSGEQICSGKAAGPTALDVVKNASAQCAFAYHITDTSFGPYLDQIGTDQAAGLIGWLYLVNSMPPSVGAADYILHTSDQVLWYYGDYQWLPSRISTTQTEYSFGSAVSATVEYFDYTDWKPLAGATVLYGAQSVVTNDQGSASFAPADGYYRIFATKDGYVRSNQILVKVGNPTTGSVDLSATVDAGSVLGDTTPPTDSIAFTVTPSSLDFGTLARGASSEKSLNLKNTGTVDTHVETAVTGDSFFVDFLTLDSAPWQKFKTDLSPNEEQQHALKLAVPTSYTSGGTKSGRITFWAVAQD